MDPTGAPPHGAADDGGKLYRALQRTRGHDRPRYSPAAALIAKTIEHVGQIGLR